MKNKKYNTIRKKLYLYEISYLFIYKRGQYYQQKKLTHSPIGTFKLSDSRKKNQLHIGNSEI